MSQFLDSAGLQQFKELNDNAYQLRRVYASYAYVSGYDYALCFDESNSLDSIPEGSCFLLCMNNTVSFAFWDYGYMPAFTNVTFGSSSCESGDYPEAETGSAVAYDFYLDGAPDPTNYLSGSRTYTLHKGGRYLVLKVNQTHFRIQLLNDNMPIPEENNGYSFLPLVNSERGEYYLAQWPYITSTTNGLLAVENGQYVVRDLLAITEASF